MTNEQAILLMQRYGRDAKRALKDCTEKMIYRNLKQLPHMAKILYPEMSLDKMQRWLGFMQGVLWAEGLYKISDLRKHVTEAKDEDQGNRQEAAS